MEEKVVEELKLKREIDQMRKEIEQLQARIDISHIPKNIYDIVVLMQASKIGFQREVEKMMSEKNDLTARIELLQNHIKSYQYQTRDLQWVHIFAYVPFGFALNS